MISNSIGIGTLAVLSSVHVIQSCQQPDVLLQKPLFLSRLILNQALILFSHETLLTEQIMFCIIHSFSTTQYNIRLTSRFVFTYKLQTKLNPTKLHLLLSAQKNIKFT